MLAYGLGVDSTAVLVELEKRKVRPDAILFADVGNEKQETYEYLPIIQDWLKKVGFPPVTVVKYIPQNFKNWPPYYSLGENCLTNGTLPSLAFGFKSCSLKWKVTPQNQWTEKWKPAVDYWYNGGKVRKIIGYDASPKDQKRYATAIGVEDPKYDYWYPLIDWNMDRDACKQSISSVGLPVPPKSACIFCPSTKPAELLEFKKEYLRYIIAMEARAFPRLEKIEGLWRNGTKGTRGGIKRPGKMTDFIIEEKLLPKIEVEKIWSSAPKDIIRNQEIFAQGGEIPDWHDFIEMFTEEDAINENVINCTNCSC
ncbi:MAG: hypothetical protein AAGB30_11160 [Pedobacter sp.]